MQTINSNTGNHFIEWKYMLLTNYSFISPGLLYTHTHVGVSGNIMMTLMNERTHLFIKIYLSHLILERVTEGLQKDWCCLCVRGELETGKDCYILTPSSSDHSSTSFAFWLGCSTVGHWGPKPSVWSWFSLRRHPISNCYSNSRLELTNPRRQWHLVI